MGQHRKAQQALLAAVGIGALLVPGAAGAVGQIKSFSYGGNGCPDGAVRYVYDEMNDALTLHFDALTTELPPGLSKACNVTFVIALPSNYQLTLRSVEHLGYIDIEPTVTARLFRLIKYGMNPPFSKTDTVSGGFTGPWTLHDEPLLSSDCGGQVTVLANIRIDLSGTPSPGRINKFTLYGPGQMKFEATPCAKVLPPRVD